MSKLRWAKFFWADWSNDSALNLCSLPAQGLWMRLLCIAAQGDPYGHVNIKGRIPTSDELFALTAPRGTRRRDWDHWMAELERMGVARRDHTRAIHSPRMSHSGTTSMIRYEAANVRWKSKENGQSQTDLHIQNPEDTPSLHMQNEPFASTEAEAEEEEEEEPPVGPREAGTRASGSNPRATGSNPRATGDSPRDLGTNPRANGTNPRGTNPVTRGSRNAFDDILREELTDARSADTEHRGAQLVPFPGRIISG